MVLGEITLATIEHDGVSFCVQVNSLAWVEPWRRGTLEEAKEVVCNLLPVPCREYVRLLHYVDDKLTQQNCTKDNHDYYKKTLQS